MLATVASLGIAPAFADGATTIGQSPPPLGLPLPDCTPAPTAHDVVQLANATGNGYVIPPGGGVITAWSRSTAKGSATVRLRVFSPASNATSITPLAESDLERLTATSPASFPTRIPVSGGELLGYSELITDATSLCLYSTGQAADSLAAATTGPLGQAETVSPSVTGYLENVSAVLEPDADGDGYGDETQDLCPIEADTHAACNDFTIGKPELNRKRGTAELEVSAPGPGTLDLSGEDVAARHVVVSPAGIVTLEVKPWGAAKRKLGRKGKVKLNLTVTYTPIHGDPATQVKRVKLKKS